MGDKMLPELELIQDRLETLTLYNYRTTKIYPSNKELTRNITNANLPCNVVEGPYINSDHYLNTHFNLLREDFLKPIREDIICYLNGSKKALSNIKIHDVRFIRKGVKRENECYCIEIQKGINFKEGKRFMTGSLVIFSADNFKTMFCSRVVETLGHSKLHVLTENVKVKYEQDFKMVECAIFFAPYYYALKVLQTISRDKFSMQKYLVKVNTSIDKPKYLQGRSYEISNPDLNESQLDAIKGALAQEFVIIQGPPGTGKTVSGLKIVKKLLSMSHLWYDESPMLIISFTNHALDQFLEGVSRFTKDILRYGGQSKNKKMEEYSMRRRRESYRFNYSMEKEIGFHYKKFKSIEEEITEIQTKIDKIKTGRSTCIYFMSLEASSMFSDFEFYGFNEYVSWLLEDDGSIKMSPQDNNNVIVNDRQKTNELFNTYIKNDVTGSSSYLSVLKMNAAAVNLYDRITEIRENIERYKSDSKIPATLHTRQLQQLNQSYLFLKRKIEYFKVCLSTDFRDELELFVNSTNPFKIPVRVRWQLHKHWLNLYGEILQEELEDLIEEYFPVYESFDCVQRESSIAVMKKQKVIGMTTTAAARMHSIIKELKCPIVIVEEAAEVLEAHIIPVLTEFCQHLILLGDHKQLRPATADYTIGTSYQLEISMFERMVKNDVKYYTLNVQHRMRPEISSLISPSIYQVLHNGSNVQNFPNIRGMKENVYFVTHDEPETASGTSKQNLYEAKFLIQLAVYLLKNNYKADEITILATYLGQVTALMEEQNACSDETVKTIKVCSVDNFQGEESKIILLSLVRSNTEKKIGFLATENRVCVALSRAKEGLYIIGNMKQLSYRSELWQKIENTLKSQNALGSLLPLECERHHNTGEIKSPEDFKIKAPNGGCNKICGEKLTFGDLCQKICHNDDLSH